MKESSILSMWIQRPPSRFSNKTQVKIFIRHFSCIPLDTSAIDIEDAERFGGVMIKKEYVRHTEPIVVRNPIDEGIREQNQDIRKTVEDTPDARKENQTSSGGLIALLLILLVAFMLKKIILG